MSRVLLPNLNLCISPVSVYLTTGCTETAYYVWCKSQGECYSFSSFVPSKCMFFLSISLKYEIYKKLRKCTVKRFNVIYFHRQSETKNSPGISMQCRKNKTHILPPSFLTACLFCLMLSFCSSIYYLLCLSFSDCFFYAFFKDNLKGILKR